MIPLLNIYHRVEFFMRIANYFSKIFYHLALAIYFLYMTNSRDPVPMITSEIRTTPQRPIFMKSHYRANREGGKTTFGQNRLPVAKIQDFRQKFRLDTKTGTWY